MKITARLIAAVLVAVAIVAAVSAYFNVQSEKRRLGSDVEHRAWLVLEGMRGSVASLIVQGPSKKLTALVEKISTSKQVLGVVIYDPAGSVVAVSKDLADKLPPKLNLLFDEFSGDSGKGMYEFVSGIEMYVYASPIVSDEGVRLGTVAIFNDVSYVAEYLSEIWRRNFVRLLVNAFLISIVVLLIVRWTVVTPITKMSEWMSGLRKGTIDDMTQVPREDLFAPITKELTSLAKSLATARRAAEEEARMHLNAESVWTKERLKEYARSKLGDKKFIVVSNREPYMHVRHGKQLECILPASGLITALDPLLRACGGLWVAHGAGNADRETVDAQNMIRVPPDNPQYDLKRVWLSQEEEEGYYYGFSNEGLWPLCHIAHTRPVFRVNDWARYQEANMKFANAVAEELDGESYIFIQDYHFSILPRLIKEKNPNAKIALFWHIPWPNPEAFAICPWKREIVHGMLGADIIGFHTQFHCNNFLETVDRTLECQTDWERFSTTRMGHTTLVKPFPISVQYPPEITGKDIPTKQELFKNLGVRASIMGLGVDRVDYTKGIPERFKAVERFLEKHPEYIGMFTFVQIGAPSREHIKRYHDLLVEVESEAERINWKFQAKGWKPIVFLKRHFSHAEIEPYYRRADVCVVNALHDGMNLVAKEFVSMREDEQGVLVLSTFTGASRELKDALLVNPYDTEQMANMICLAVEMDVEDQKLRMIRMRTAVKENNIYKWAADIITDLTQIRSEIKQT